MSKLYKFLSLLTVVALGERVTYLPPDEEDGILLTKCWQTIGQRKRAVECRVGTKCVSAKFVDPSNIEYAYASCTWQKCDNILANLSKKKKLAFKMKSCNICDKSLCNDFTPTDHQLRGDVRDGELVHKCAQTTEHDINVVECRNQTRCLRIDFQDKNERKYTYAACATEDQPQNDCNEKLVNALIDRYPNDWKLRKVNCVSCGQRRCNMFNSKDTDFLIAVKRQLPVLKMTTRDSREGAREMLKSDELLKKHYEL